MNQLQKIITAACIAIAIGMFICPPWVEFYFGINGNGQPGRKDRGYHLIWNKPENTPHTQPKHKGVRIYSSRMTQQLLGLGVIWIIATSTVKRKNKACSEQK